MNRLVRHLTEHARHFLLLESAGGIVMLAFAALAIALANSPLSEIYTSLIHAPLFGAFTVGHFTVDVLMVIFFFAVGMELKLEMCEGALSEKGQKLLPLIAALGGIAVPALLYLFITRHHPELQSGWAIPTATDIAFAMCVLRLVGGAVPPAAKIFLLAIAIYDDLAAILIIALFYSSGLALAPLAAVAVLGALLYALNRAHVGHLALYLTIGVALWFALHAQASTPPLLASWLASPFRYASATARRCSAIRSTPSTPPLPSSSFPCSPSPARGSTCAPYPSTKPSPPCPSASRLPCFLANKSALWAPRFAAVRLGLSPLPKDVELAGGLWHRHSCGHRVHHEPVHRQNWRFRTHYCSMK